jgi:hypothetical protein
MVMLVVVVTAAAATAAAVRALAKLQLYGPLWS